MISRISNCKPIDAPAEFASLAVHPPTNFLQSQPAHINPSKRLKRAANFVTLINPAAHQVYLEQLSRESKNELESSSDDTGSDSAELTPCESDEDGSVQVSVYEALLKHPRASKIRYRQFEAIRQQNLATSSNSTLHKNLPKSLYQLLSRTNTAQGLAVVSNRNIPMTAEIEIDNEESIDNQPSFQEEALESKILEGSDSLQGKSLSKPVGYSSFLESLKMGLSAPLSPPVLDTDMGYNATDEDMIIISESEIDALSIDELDSFQASSAKGTRIIFPKQMFSSFLLDLMIADSKSPTPVLCWSSISEVNITPKSGTPFASPYSSGNSTHVSTLSSPILTDSILQHSPSHPQSCFIQTLIPYPPAQSSMPSISTQASVVLTSESNVVQEMHTTSGSSVSNNEISEYEYSAQKAENENAILFDQSSLVELDEQSPLAYSVLASSNEVSDPVNSILEIDMKPAEIETPVYLNPIQTDCNVTQERILEDTPIINYICSDSTVSPSLFVNSTFSSPLSPSNLPPSFFTPKFFARKKPIQSILKSSPGPFRSKFNQIKTLHRRVTFHIEEEHSPSSRKFKTPISRRPIPRRPQVRRSLLELTSSLVLRDDKIDGSDFPMTQNQWLSIVNSFTQPSQDYAKRHLPPSFTTPFQREKRRKLLCVRAAGVILNPAIDLVENNSNATFSGEVEGPMRPLPAFRQSNRGKDILARALKASSCN